MIMTKELAPATGANAIYALTPGQQRAYEQALATIPGAAITVIKGDVGTGKSLVVSHLQAQLGGTVHSLDSILGEAVKRGAGHVEEALVDLMTDGDERLPVLLGKAAADHEIAGVVDGRLSAQGAAIFEVPLTFDAR